MDYEECPPLLEESLDGYSQPVWLLRPEMRYTVKTDGTIVGIETPDLWEYNAKRNNGTEEVWSPQEVIGGNILSSMTPFYKKLFSEILVNVSSGKCGVVGWKFSCDAPGICRNYMLYITRVNSQLLEFSSTQLDEHQRREVFQGGFEDCDIAPVEACGWCSKMRHRDSTKWQSPDTFHTSIAALGMSPPPKINVKYVSCEQCARELSLNGLGWLPFLPRNVTDVTSRLSLIGISEDYVLLRELSVRATNFRPWHALNFPIKTRRSSPVPFSDKAGRPPADGALSKEAAREAVRVFILSNPSCGAICTDDPELVVWFKTVGGVCYLLHRKNKKTLFYT